MSTVKNYLAYVKSNGFFLALVLFITGYYWIPSSKSLNNVYYLFVLAPLVAACFFVEEKRRKIITLLSGYRYFIIFVALMLLSCIVNPFDTEVFLKSLTRIMYIIGFLLAIHVSVSKLDSLGVKIFPALMVFVSLTAIYKIYGWLSVHSLQSRMEGAGVTENPILLAVVYAVAVLTAILAFLRGEGKSSWLYLAAAMSCAAVVLLAQSRGPLLALVVATVLALIFIRGRRSFVIGVCMLIAGAAFIFQYADSRLLSSAAIRPDIWLAVLEKMATSPWLGFGLQENEAVQIGAITYPHPHSIYITTLLHGGGVGLGAFIVMIARTLFADLKNDSLLPWRILLCLGLIYSLFDGYRIFSHPEELWLVFWLPIGVLLARTTPKIGE